MDLTLLTLGLATGLLVGLTAAGGGAVLTPALVLGFGVPAPVAIGTDTVVAGVWRLVAGGTYAAQRAVDWKLTGALALGSVPGVLAGTQLIGVLPDAAVLQLIGAAVVLAGGVTLWRLRRPEAGPSTPRTPGWAATAAAGALTGLLVGATSVGGGTVLLAILAVGFPLSASRLVGTDLAHGLVLAVVAGAAHGVAGRIDLALAAPLLIGGVPGAWAGARLATRVPDRALRVTLATVLLVIGLGLVTEVHP